MISGPHIEEVKEWSELTAPSSSRVEVNALIHKLNVNPALRRRTIWGFCDTIELPAGAPDQCDSKYAVILFSQNQVIGRVDFRRDTDCSRSGNVFPDADKNVTWTDVPGAGAMHIKDTKNLGTLRQGQFYVAPMHVISDCDAVGLFVESILSNFTTIQFLTGLRVISTPL